ncbi:MAG: rhodanese-like domain-containing protein [Rikenellaceae bacterium]|nr:rhodanese-like domain-containing protein [Rikenellaceae bacterium]
MKRNLIALAVAFVSTLFGCSAGSHFTSLDVDAFGAEIQKPGVQIVDVRTPAEYDSAHIPGAINIDVMADDFEQNIQVLSKKHTVAVYCRSGRRSKTAAEILAKAGYRVVELNGGILSWRGSLEN